MVQDWNAKKDMPKVQSLQLNLQESFAAPFVIFAEIAFSSELTTKWSRNTLWKNFATKRHSKKAKLAIIRILLQIHKQQPKKTLLETYTNSTCTSLIP